MAQRTIAHMYNRYEEAEQVVSDLEASGILHSDISLVANADARGQAADSTAPTGATAGGAGGGAGALLGTALGGGAGLLAGIGALAIPGVGPVVAAGWLVATLTGAGIGAVGGGLVGSLTGAGFSHEQAGVYAEHVRGGGSLVSVRVDEADAVRVEGIMAQRGAVNWDERRAALGSDWSGFDANKTTGINPTAATPVSATGSSGLDVPGADPLRRA